MLGIIGDVNKMVEHHIVDTNKMITMAQQTAVEWLVEQMEKDSYQILFGKLNASIETIEQAKAMEKEQLRKCYEHAMLSLLDTGHGDSFEDYYNKTFKDKIWHNKQLFKN